MSVAVFAGAVMRDVDTARVGEPGEPVGPADFIAAVDRWTAERADRAAVAVMEGRPV
jgi:hypothetical protein